MTSEQWLILLILAGYALVGSVAIWGVCVVMKSFAGRWQRRAAVSLVAAVFFTPGVYVGNNGGLIPVPMWMSIGQMTSDAILRPGLWTAGVAPIVVIFALLFIIGSIVSWVRSSGV